jgi:TetR/AcrR family transcriptional regulator, cholesterol catabolism regulator
MFQEFSTSNTLEIKDRIIAKSRELFFRYGVKSVTMDDIASDLGISKKTIYQHFEDKDDIVHQMMEIEMANDKCEWEDLEKVSKNVIEKSVKSMEFFKQAFTEINPSAFFDIKKYHPKTWQLFQDHKQNFILASIIKDLKEGIEQGFFRPEIKVDILAKMRLEQIEIAFDPHLFPTNKFSVVDVEITMLDHFFRGIMTEKGLKVYEECL